MVAVAAGRRHYARNGGPGTGLASPSLWGGGVDDGGMDIRHDWYGGGKRQRQYGDNWSLQINTENPYHRIRSSPAKKRENTVI